TKKLAKLDWNITKDHRLSARYSETEGNQPFYPSFNTTGFSSSVTIPRAGNTGYSNGITSYSSKFYRLSVIEKVWAAQLFNNWTPDFKTQFSFSQNDTTSLRSTPVNFPEIRILNVPGISSTGSPINTLNAISIGTDVSSMGNGVISNSISYG